MISCMICKMLAASEKILDSCHLSWDYSCTWCKSFILKAFFLVFIWPNLKKYIFFSFLIHIGSTSCYNCHWRMAVASTRQILVFSQADSSVTWKLYWWNSWKYVSRTILFFLLFLFFPSAPLNKWLMWKYFCIHGCIAWRKKQTNLFCFWTYLW